ncbi:ribbon-helix-helix domain-containing protein [Devosia faecipullorum]|uniref:ribbon-helix-helix domain-containing protein n=1 Tax=Devosia faecipullorum TaxID=2755039 RepID=UPI00187B7E4F|nr:ribbon-helix-helix domain-containing protein [Devosia faecipullorum]MBE7732241.1 ribbon-helix-helix domain-containing protein [Devosia faecipullorum]
MQKRSFSIAGHRTSIALEPDFWRGLEIIAEARGLSLAALVRDIDEHREIANLSSAVRLAVLAFYRDRAEIISAATPPAENRD